MPAIRSLAIVFGIFLIKSMPMRELDRGQVEQSHAL